MANVKGEKIIEANISKNTNTIKASLNKEPYATTEKAGIIRIATDEEAIEGISTNTAITPSTLKKVTSFIHTQGIASDTWIINHNLNKRPSVTVVDSAYLVQLPDDILYNSDNQITLKFISAFAGEAYLN